MDAFQRKEINIFRLHREIVLNIIYHKKYYNLINFNNFLDEYGGEAKTHGNLDWKDYVPITDLNAFIERMADKNDFARIVNIGQSYECRDMKVLAIEKVKIASFILLSLSSQAKE